MLFALHQRVALPRCTAARSATLQALLPRESVAGAGLGGAVVAGCHTPRPRRAPARRALLLGTARVRGGRGEGQRSALVNAPSRAGGRHE